MEAELAKAARRLIEAERVRLLAHADADGISAAAILAKALYRSSQPLEIRLIENFSKDRLAEARKDRGDSGERALLDLGSDLAEISAVLPGSIVIDHHKINGSGNVLLVNPRTRGLSTPTAVLAYLIAKRIDPGAYEYSYLALVGAQGDNMLSPEDPLVRSVLEEASQRGIVRLERGRRVYDSSRPLEEIIADLVNRRLKPREVSEKLKELNIRASRLKDLGERERAIIQEAFGIKPEEIYAIAGEDKPMVSTVHEFATLLNACARMGHPGLALAVALGDRGEIYLKAYNVYKEYRRSLFRAIRETSENAFEYKGLKVVFLRSSDYRKASPVATIMRKKNPGALRVVFGQQGDRLKVSVRGPGKVNEITQRAARLVGGQGGGHDVAAGATIPADAVMDFLDTLASLRTRFKNKGSLSA